MPIVLVYILLWIDLLVYAVHTRAGKRWTGWLATGMMLLCWGLVSYGLVQRGMESGHWPFINRYEFALCFLWVMIGIYLLLEVSWRERRAGPYVLVIILVIGTYIVTRPDGETGIVQLLPALRSIWLQLHVLTSLVGYGAFGVAAGIGLLRWVQHKSLVEDKANPLNPTRAEIEKTMEQVVALGFPWLTLGIITGAAWAQEVWGRYWGWDPKETWALISWLWYILIMHLRALRSWRGRQLAGLIIIGFVVILFTFIGVPWLVRTVRLDSLHGF